MQTEIIELTKLAPRKRHPFGEFLVSERVLDRAQLFRALQLQDRLPAARLGWCAVALGYAPRSTIEQLYARFAARFANGACPPPDDFEQLETESFEREETDISIEVEYPVL